MAGSIQHIQNEEYYKLVADNINDLVALYALDGRLEYASPSVYRLLGYEEGTLEGLYPYKLIHPDDHHLLKNTFKTKANEPDVITFEYRLLHKNGTWIYFETYRKPIYDGDGHFINVLAVCRDISARKEAERARKENEEHYRMLADNIIDMVSLYSTDGTAVYLSPSCFSLLGYMPEELMGKNLSIVVHPDDLVKFRNDVRLKAYKGAEKFITEARLQHKNGQWRYCETTTKAIRDTNGRVHSFVGTTRDITEWKMAQIALKESEERYRSLVEASDTMISILDVEGRFLFVNDKRAKYFDTPKQNILGKTIYDFYGPKDTESFKSNVQRICETKQNLLYEACASLHGKDFWVRVNMHPILNADGDVTAILVNTIDITKDKEREEALRKQNEELRQIAFLQSHIVRSPLTNILGLIALIEESGITNEQEQYFEMLKHAAGTLDDILKDIVARAVEVRHKTG